MTQTGRLYIVATPIGHLDDITYRAVTVLHQVHGILAEDTRHSRRLLAHYAIKTPLIALHNYNEYKKSLALIKALCKGKTFALISDAGTPLISDPGYLLVKKALEAHCQVIPIPGPCAAIAALSASGLPTQRFSFEGFLPSKATQRQAHLHTLKQETRTLIFYEAPHRLLATLEALSQILGPHRLATLARELTKTFETIKQASLHDMTHWVSHHPEQQKGECVIVVAGADAKAQQAAAKTEALTLLHQLTPALSKRDAVKLAAQITGYPKNQLYESIINHTDKGTSNDSPLA